MTDFDPDVWDDGWDKPPDEDLDEEDRFWAARPELTHIRLYAQARQTPPWAALGVVLARVVTAVPPFVVLPPIVGSWGSLNLFVGIVGRAGAGKGAGEAVAAEAIDVGEITTRSVGSGEGIAHVYMRRTRQGVEQIETAALFSVQEIGSIQALGARSGSTLWPELRKAWMGEQLGFQYADETKRLTVRKHSYRLTMVMGIQPSAAEVLMSDADTGTPQRFLWLPASDHRAPYPPPEDPEPYPWILNSGRPWYTTHGDKVVMGVDPAIKEEIQEDRYRMLREDSTTLEAHTMMARLKTAAALALLNERCAIDANDWKLSAHIIRKSRQTRQFIQDEISKKYRASNRARAEQEAERTIIVSATVDRDARERVSHWIERKLKSASDWVDRRELQRSINSRDRKSLRDVLEFLIERGFIEADTTMGTSEHGTRYRWKGK